MSRNLIEYSNHLFEKIVGDANILNKDKMRVRINSDPIESEKELAIFKGLNVISVNYILHNIKVCAFHLDGLKYVLMTNLEDYFLDGNDRNQEISVMGINKVPINTGHFLALVKDADLAIKNDLGANFLEENILHQQDGEDYNSHSFEDLIDVIEKFTIFEISHDSLFYDSDLVGIGYYIYSSIDTLVHLPIKDLIPKAREMMLPYTVIPKENLFIFLTATHWNHAFLELYRCLEGIYSIPRVIELKKTLNLAVPAYEIAKHCYSDLGWKRKEEDSLIRLIKLMKIEDIIGSGIFETELFSHIVINVNRPEDNKVKVMESIAKHIYKIRNQLVHQVELEDRIKILDLDWPILLRFILLNIENAFLIYKDEIAA